MTELYRISALEWEQDEYGDWFANPINDTCVMVCELDDEVRWWIENTLKEEQVCGSVEEAKAAAEAHWQARIKECLEVAEPETSENSCPDCGMPTGPDRFHYCR